MIEQIKENQCTGCKMCADLCPQDAILFTSDQYGFWYPKVETEQCINCRLCVEQCPGLVKFSSLEYHEPKVYAAWLNDKEKRLQSTSGGVYYALASEILRRRGVVVACEYTDDFKHAKHVVVTTNEQLEPTMRSKYFQSDTAGIYETVKKLLEQNNEVLFCGTPCQCAAMQRYVGAASERLFTMDFICRGNNSPKAYVAFINELEDKYQSPVKNVHFKHKRMGWKSLGLLITFENGKEYFDTRENSYWTLGYIKDNLYMRPVCHECQYRTIPRSSDLTVGDFWGVDGVSEEEMFAGVSVVFANSKKGQMLLCETGNILHIEERVFDDVLKGNPCLKTSPQRGIHRAEFFDMLERMPFSKAVEACCGKIGER